MGPTVLAKTVSPLILSRKKMSHIAEIYRLFPTRITAEVVFPNDVLLLNLNSITS